MTNESGSLLCSMTTLIEVELGQSNNNQQPTNSGGVGSADVPKNMGHEPWLYDDGSDN